MGGIFINNGTLTNSGTVDLQGGATDAVFGTTTVKQPKRYLDRRLQLGAPFTQTATGTLRLNHDARPVIGSVTTTSTATLAGCIGGTGPTLPGHTTLTGMTASLVTGTFSCTDFVTQQFNLIYSATMVQLVVPNTTPVARLTRT